MRRLIELTRFVVAVPALAAIVGSFVLMVIGTKDVAQSVIKLFDSETKPKESVVSVLTAVDTLLLATVLLVIGYGLYELFVDDQVKLPAWLEIHSLDDLKSKLIGVVVVVIGVNFLGFLVDSKDPDGLLKVGLSSAAVVAGLAVFQIASKMEK